MIQIALEQVQVAIGHTPDRKRILQLVDERSGIMVVVPFDALAAAKIGRELAQGAAEENGSQLLG